VTDRRLRMIRGSDELAREVLATLDETTIAVHVDEGAPWAHQLLAEALVDILGRLFPRVLVTGPGETAAHPDLPPGPALVAERLEAARAHGVAPLDPGEPALTVVIGSAEGGDIYCDGEGWQAYLGPAPSLIGEHTTPLPIGPLAAACRAAARVFTVVMEPFGAQAAPFEPVYWSALTYMAAAEPLAEPELGVPAAIEAVLAGAGSVGGAAAYTFARAPGLGGEFDIVDPQALEPHNPDRALLATEALAQAGAVKVEIAADALAHLPLEVRKHRMFLEEWVASRPREAGLPLALCSYDTAEARRELQDCLPLEVINAACGPDSVMVSGHRTGTGPCLYCVYMPQVMDVEQITFRLIVEATRLPAPMVQGLLQENAPLARFHLEQIEYARGFAPGTLDAYLGKTLDELYRGALMYAEREFERGDSAAAVATPFVTALAGVLLASEALKAGGGEEYAAFRLGPWAPGRNRYDESLASSAAHGFTSTVPRWADERCLCRSARRERLLGERYGLAADEGAGPSAMN
jgi:hypothetical protein